MLRAAKLGERYERRNVTSCGMVRAMEWYELGNGTGILRTSKHLLYLLASLSLPGAKLCPCSRRFLCSGSFRGPMCGYLISCHRLPQVANHRNITISLRFCILLIQSHTHICSQYTHTHIQCNNPCIWPKMGAASLHHAPNCRSDTCYGPSAKPHTTVL